MWCAVQNTLVCRCNIQCIYYTPDEKGKVEGVVIYKTLRCNVHFEAGFAAFPNQPMHEEQIAREQQSKQSKIAP